MRYLSLNIFREEGTVLSNMLALGSEENYLTFKQVDELPLKNLIYYPFLCGVVLGISTFNLYCYGHNYFN